LLFIPASKLAFGGGRQLACSMCVHMKPIPDFFAPPYDFSLATTLQTVLHFIQDGRDVVVSSLILQRKRSSFIGQLVRDKKSITVFPLTICFRILVLNNLISASTTFSLLSRATPPSSPLGAPSNSLAGKAKAPLDRHDSFWGRKIVKGYRIIRA
jgi:hypothetical protein